MHELDATTKAVWVLLGSIGGAAKVMVQLIGTKVLPSKLNIFWMFSANMFVSGFAGFLGASLATQFTIDNNLHVVVAGVAGYMGVAALDLFSLWLKTRVQKP